MRRLSHFTICSVLLLMTAVVPAFAGEVIDGVVASVNRQPVLRSDWDEAVAFEAFMGQKPISQVTETDRVLALQHLIDRHLLQAQMGDATYMQPSEATLRQDLAKLRAQVPNGNDDVAWQRLLASYGLTEELVEDHLRTEVQVMNFVEVRLRPDVHVQEDEVDAYYKNQLLPDLQKNGGKPIPLDEVGPRIRELLTQQRIGELLDAWLHNLRQQADIHSSVSIPGVNAPGDAAVTSPAGN
ncbi:MAG: SurA N-terminal domain-containing protein [Candidatus Korobacteraceae bacterium]|jgi:SurA-like protein